MGQKLYFACFIGLFLSGFLFGDNYIVEIKAETREQRSELAKIIHIDGFTKTSVFAVINFHDYRLLQDKFGAKIISVEIITNKLLNNYYGPFILAANFPGEDDIFHTYEELTQVLDNLAQEYPNLVSFFSLGESIEGREIWGIKITNLSHDLLEQDKAGIVLMGTHHAREHVSTELPLFFAQEILRQEKTDLEIQELLSQIEIYIIPMVNPDGAMFDIAGGNYKYWRKNRSHNHDGTYGVDLNRNYGWGWGTGGSSTNPSSDVYMGPEPFSEPETQYIKEFFENNSNINLAVSFHTYSELILYPWGGKDSAVVGDDGEIFKKMAQDMADMNGYQPMQSSELYIASGDTCDYLYGEHSVYCFTFELSPNSWWHGGFYPGASILDQVYAENYDPLMYLLRRTKEPESVLK